MSLTGDNGAQLTMPVMPAGMGGGYGMGGFGGDGWWGILFLIAIMCGGWGGLGGFGGMGGLGMMWPFLFGGFGNGFGGGSAATQGALTREQACIDQNFNNLARTAEATNSAVNQGFANLNSTICHQQYDTAQMINGVTGAVTGGFAALNSTICQQQYDTAQQLNGINNTIQGGFNAANIVALQNQNATQAQMADCCCKMQTGQMQLGNQIERGFCQINYNDQANTNAIIQNAHNDTDRVLARLDAFERNQDKETIANLRQQLQDARFQASQVAQNGAIQNMVNASTAEILHRSGHDCPSAAYIVQPPTPVTFQTNGCGQAVFANGYGYNGGCCNG